jgi:hypothetical protein
MGISQGNGFVGTPSGCSHDHCRHNTGVMHTLDNLLDIAVIYPVIKMAVTVKQFHYG